MSSRFIACLLAAVLLPPAVAQAQETNRFKTSLTLGATITDGNKQTLQANASLVTEGEKTRLGSLRAGVEANYSESKTNGAAETTVDNARIFANAKKTLGKRAFASLDASAMYDDVAQVDYRAMSGLGLGVYVVKNDKTSVAVEAGPSYVWEEVADVKGDYLAVRFSERFSYAFSGTSKIWQSAEYVPKADEFNDYLLNAEVGIEAAVSTRVNLRVVFQDKYDSTPGEGLKQNSLTLITGVSIKL